MAKIPKVRKGSPFRLILDTDTSLSGGSSPTVYWKKQNGTTGSQAGTVDASELIYTDIPGSETDIDGIMQFECSYTFNGDSAATRSWETALILIVDNFKEN